MINKINQYAMVKFAGDKKACTEFVEGFYKEAGYIRTSIGNTMNLPTNQALDAQGKSRSAETLGQAITKGIGGSVGQGIGGLAVTGMVATAGNLFNSVKGMALHSKFLQSLERAYQTNRILKESPKELVLQYAETIFKFAPNVATDPNLLSSILANAIHGEGIDPMTIKTLTELEGRFSDNNSFNPKNFSK